MGVRRGRAWPAGQSPRTSHPNAGPENPRVQHYGQATARPRGESYAFGGKGRKYLLEPEQGHLEREHKGRLVHKVTMPSATLRGRSSTAVTVTSLKFVDFIAHGPPELLRSFATLPMIVRVLRAALQLCGVTWERKAGIQEDLSLSLASDRGPGGFSRHLRGA